MEFYLEQSLWVNGWNGWNGKISFIRDCSGQGYPGECKQIYTGAIIDDGAAGRWAGTGGGGSWTMRKR